MKNSFHERVRELLDLAMEQPSSERIAFIERESAGNPSLCREVGELLSSLERAGAMFEPRRRSDVAESQTLSGERIGVYLVEERIGAGGMGVVYRAVDTRLGRSVAVKTLPNSCANHPVRRARLEQEARALAALNHPNIAAIYGAEDTERGAILLLEFVPGETLAQLLARGPLAADEAIAIARQIALGLEAAHATGVVHRDLKPANIRITPEQSVKVLDFGIAEMLGDEARGGTMPPGKSAEAAAPVTPSGSGGRLATPLFGTAAYMSPEQARGRRVDRRADVWAFGCVLYEMLTGTRPFSGATTSDTIAAVLQAEPDWSRLPASTPAAIRRLLERCLRKDPDRRLRDLADARIELEESLQEESLGEARRPGRLRWVALALLGTATGLVGWWSGRVWTPQAAPPRDSRFGLHSDVSLPIDWDPGASFTISPTGDTVAFTGFLTSEPQALYVHPLDSLEPKRIEGVGGAARIPRYSPDGAWIAFTDASASRLMRYSVRSGTIEPFGNASPDASGIDWLDADTILFSDAEGLWEVDVVGGPRRLTTLDASAGETLHGHVCSVGDGEHILFTCRRDTRNGERCSLELLSRSDGRRQRLRDDAWAPMTLDGDTLLWCEASGLLAARFDPSTATIAGVPALLIDSLAGAGESLPIRRAALAADGTLVYLPATGNIRQTNLGWAHRDGSTQRFLSGDRPIFSPRASSDERHVAFAVRGSHREIWLRDMTRGTTLRISPDDGRERDFPLWTPDQNAVVVASWDEDDYRIERLGIDDGAEPAVLLEGSRHASATANAFTPDGASLVLSIIGADGMRDLYLMPAAGGASPEPVFKTHQPRNGARFSPDGRAILYVLDHPDGASVIAESWPSLDRKVQCSESVGFRAEWRQDGRAVFYQSRNELWEADVTTTPKLEVGPRRLLFDAFPDVRYGVAADGDRFLIPLAPSERRSGTQFAIIRNFDDCVRDALSALSR
ncbi:MAG: protein kinase [Phycisphaerae bacterium]|jgi:serine/threonine protein kinase/Tol biopolymer transport system component|nr:protein kinase [Phycisphaerae bacterium]